MEEEHIPSTVTDDLELTPVRLQPVITQTLLAGELTVLIRKVAHDMFAQGFYMMGGVPVGEKSQNKELECVKEERDFLLEELNLYKMDSEEREKSLLEKEVAMKRMARYLKYLERIVNHLETEKSLLIKKNKELLSFSLEAATSGTKITDKTLITFVFVFKSCNQC